MLNEINNYIKNHIFFELSLYKFEGDTLVLAGSDDFSYYHLIEIKFHSVYSVICNTYFKVNTNNCILSTVIDPREALEINSKFGIIVGYEIYKIISEDGQYFYIVAGSISYEIKTVKYFP